LKGEGLWKSQGYGINKGKLKTPIRTALTPLRGKKKEAAINKKKEGERKAPRSQKQRAQQGQCNTNHRRRKTRQ